MSISYFRAAIRLLVREKLYSLINIIGLAIGIACSLLLFVFIQHEGSYDSFQKKGDRIFRLVTQRKNPDGSVVRVGLSPVPLAPALETNFPQVEGTVTLVDDQVTIVRENDAFKQPVLFAASTFFRVFSFPLIHGDANTVLSEPNSLVLTASTASKIFGSENPVGKRMTLVGDGNRELVVSGVAADPPSNTSIPFEAVLSLQLLPGYKDLVTNWGSSNCYTFLQLGEGSDPANLIGRFGPFVNLYYADRVRQGKESGSISKEDDAWQLQLQPLREIHTDPTVRWSIVPPANPLQSDLLAAVAIIIVLIACLNYSILGIARSSHRAREIGLRKVVGAGRRQLILQFWGEALALTLLASGLGFVLAELLIPEFSRLALRALSIEQSLSAISVGLWLLFVVFVALLSSSYPAFVLAKFKPVDALRTRLRLHGNNAAGRVLVGLQFVFGIVLMISAVMMTRQMSFVQTKELGYSAKNILVVPADDAGYGAVGAFVAQATLLPGVSGVSTVNNTFTRGGMRTDITVDGRAVKTEVYFVSSDFMRTLGLAIIEGENFSTGLPESNSPIVIVNEAFRKKLPWTAAVGKTLDLAGKPRIVGVVKDFNFHSLKEEIQPALFYLNPRASSSNVLIRLNSGDLPGSMSRLNAAWKRAAPFHPFDYYFLDVDLVRQYLEDERWNTIVLYGAIVSLSIAAMGLFGIASLSAARRKKEIGLRKIFGSSVSGILSLLSKDLLTLAAVANLVAWPLAYVAVEQWLKSFAYRTNWDIMVIALCGIGSIFIVFAGMAFQTIRAALANPVDSLRYE